MFNQFHYTEQLKRNKEYVELLKAETKATNDLLNANKKNKKEYEALKAAYTAATKAVNDYQKAKDAGKKKSIIK